MKTKQAYVILVAFIIALTFGVAPAIAGASSQGADAPMQRATQAGDQVCIPASTQTGQAVECDGEQTQSKDRVRSREQLRVNENEEPACDDGRTRSQERVNEAPAPDDSEEPTGSVEPTPTVDPISTIEPTSTVAAVTVGAGTIAFRDRVVDTLPDGLVVWFRSMLGYLGLA